MEAGHFNDLLKINYDGKERLVEPYSLAYKTRQDGYPGSIYTYMIWVEGGVLNLY